MKKISILIILAAAALTLVPSCTELGGPTMKEGAYLLKLDVACTDLQTKSAGTEVENLIKHVDYFFYADEAGTTPLGIHGRVTLPTTDGLTFDTSIAGYEALQKTSYVYVLANYPGTINHDTDNPTLATLLALPVEKPLYTAATDTQAAQQPDCFVMDSYAPATQTTSEKYTVQLKPAAQDEVRTQTILLSRLAVKLTVQLNIEASVTTINPITGEEETWTPVEDQMAIYYVNSLNKSTVAGTPTQVLQQEGQRDGYFSYPTDYGYTGSNHVYMTDPAYTYPQTWSDADNGEPYFKLQLPWQGSIMGTSPFYYKIPVPQVADKTLNRNCWYQVQLRVGVLGGTENDYVLTDYEYCVADWASPSWFSGSGLNSAKYFYVPGSEFHIYGDDHIDIPYFCNAEVNVDFDKITYWDYNYNTAGDSIERPREYSGTSEVSVQDYGGPGNHTYTLSADAENKVVKFQHEMTNLYVMRTITLTITNSENANQSKTVTIYQHPAIELKKTTAGDVFVDGYFAYVVDPVNQNGTRFGTSVETRDGKTFYRSPNGAGSFNNNYFTPNNWTYVAIAARGAVSQGVSQNFFTTDLTITAFNDGVQEDGTVDENLKNNTYTVQETTSTSWNNLRNHTYSYKIGDPRATASSVYGNGWSLRNYLSNATQNNETTAAWQSAGNIMICGQDAGTNTNNRNTIAPHILISSGLNFMQNAASLENVVKRAATYQEAGYPAGRWRLPSEAEIAFIYARQQDDTIPHLFADNTEYWAGSGRVVRLSGGTVQFKAASSSQTYRARFVYDIWYWGDEPAAGNYSSNQYHPNGHVVSYK